MAFDLMILEVNMEGPSYSNLEPCTTSLNQIRDALYVLSGKWKLPIIFTLIESPKRFKELQRVLPGVTSRTLIHELKILEANGFVERTADSLNSNSMWYGATEYSNTLKNVLNELRAWGEQHRVKLREDNKRTQSKSKM